MKPEIDITGVILAGGQSRRFGTDKARALIWPEKKPLISRLSHLLNTLQMSPFVVCDRKDKYRDLGISCVTDIIPDKGPLGGVYTALQTAGVQKILVLTCDMPFVGAGVLRKLIQIGRATNHGVFYGTERGLEPFPGIYTQKDLPVVKYCLEKGHLEMKSFLSKKENLHVIPFRLGTMDFFNMNTPADYRTIEESFKTVVVPEAAHEKASKNGFISEALMQGEGHGDSRKA